MFLIQANIIMTGCQTLFLAWNYVTPITWWIQFVNPFRLMGLHNEWNNGIGAVIVANVEITWSITNSCDNTGLVVCTGNWPKKISRIIIKNANYGFDTVGVKPFYSLYSIQYTKTTRARWSESLSHFTTAQHSRSWLVTESIPLSLNFWRLTEWRDSLNHFTKPHLVWSPVTF